jgi:hypothetical protein
MVNPNWLVAALAHAACTSSWHPSRSWTAVPASCHRVHSARVSTSAAGRRHWKCSSTRTRHTPSRRPSGSGSEYLILNTKRFWVLRCACAESLKRYDGSLRFVENFRVAARRQEHFCAVPWLSTHANACTSTNRRRYRHWCRASYMYRSAKSPRWRNSRFN